MAEESALWIYQLSSKQWSQGEYRLDVREGQNVTWPMGSLRGPGEPEPGDRIVCWWAKTGATEYGVVGWGTYVGAAYGDDIRWIPHPPTDRWSMSPLCSDELEGIIDRIRGGFNNATMFLASPEDSADLTAAIKAADR